METGEDLRGRSLIFTLTLDAATRRRRSVSDTSSASSARPSLFAHVHFNLKRMMLKEDVTERTLRDFSKAKREVMLQVLY
jgi:hypothetical protein